VKFIFSTVAIAFVFFTSNVNAGTVYSNSFSGLQQLENPGELSVTFSDVGFSKDATLDFNLNGFRTLDGSYTVAPGTLDYSDTFNLLLNGALIYQAKFGLGGPPANGVPLENLVIYNPLGVTYSNYSSQDWVGGMVSITAPLALSNGTNTLTFKYTTPTPEGVGNEAWNVANVKISAAVAPVPEPETYALLLAGLGLIGAVKRRKAKRA
jgi:hypothetical protein